MSSSFAWLDFSDRDKKRAMDVVDLFGREQGTVDDLGLGPVRDAFSEMLFPGISTVQTRAKYFLFIPWTYLGLEERRTPSSRIREVGRAAEVALMKALLDSGESEGVIGRTVGNRVKQLPSFIYWGGLGRIGIRMFAGSQSDYHRSLNAYYERISQARTRERGEGESPEREVWNWHAALPPRPEGFPRGATFLFSRQEAEYFSERVRTSAPGTLLSFLLDGRHDDAEAEFPWHHPNFAEFPEKMRDQLHNARVFSELMHGASLIYNLMLSEAIEHSEWIELYRESFDEWVAQIRPHYEQMISWDRSAFWQLVASEGASVGRKTQSFIDSWWNLVAQHELAELVDDKNVRHLITNRESVLKGPRARLQSPRALENWRGASGIRPLSYRWPNARQTVKDVVGGTTR